MIEAYARMHAARTEIEWDTAAAEWRLNTQAYEDLLNGNTQ